MTEENIDANSESKIIYPPIEVINDLIDGLRHANLSRVSYLKIFYLIWNEIKTIPFTTSKLKKGHHIFRARVNEGDEMFESESQISYRTDNENITKYGRANVPKQSLFYGAIKSEIIPEPRLTNLLEISEIFRSGDFHSTSEFLMTVGQWEIQEDFEIVEMAFNQNSIDLNPEVKMAYEFHMDLIKQQHPQLIEQIETVLKFFSDEFAKKDIKSHSDYKISAAYTDITINFREHAGIAYPSVRSDAGGTNVVLSIWAVEKYLKLKNVAMFKVYKRGDQVLVDNYKYVTELGPLNSKFEWDDLDQTNQSDIEKILQQRD